MAIKISGVTVIDDTKIGIFSGINLGPTAVSGPIKITQGSPGASVILSYATATYKSAEVTLQITQDVAFEITKFLVISNGTDVYLEEYGKIGSATNVVISAAVSGGTVTVTATSQTTGASFTGHSTLITV